MSKLLWFLRVLYKKPQPVITREEALQIAYRYIDQKGYLLRLPLTISEVSEVSEEFDAYCVNLSPGVMRVNVVYINFADGHIIKHIASEL